MVQPTASPTEAATPTVQPAASPTDASDGAEPTPTLDAMMAEIMGAPTATPAPPTPTYQDTGVGPVELVRKFDVPSPNLSGLALDRDGNIYVSSKSDGRVMKFNAEGEMLLTWSSDTLGSNSGLGAIDGQGNLYFASPRHDIQVFDSGGTFLRKWGGQGIGDGQFYGIGGMAIDRQGNFFVTDPGNQRVQKFDPSGKFLLKWGSGGSDDGQFKVPAGIVVDTQDNVYVSDHEQGTVQKFDSKGTFLLKWGSRGSDPGQFNQHAVAAVDSRGDVYVTDVLNGRIQKFDPDGKFLVQWNTSGGERLVYPEGVRIDKRGYLYVREDREGMGQPRIHIFRPRE